MPTPIDLVLVGNRPGALHAASRLGLRVLLVEEERPSAAARRRIAGWVEAPLEGAQDVLLERTRDALGTRRPRGVVAAGEWGVLAAATLRASLALGGLGPETAHLARDKPGMKFAARAAGVACTDWEVLDERSEAESLVERLGLPVVLKHRAGVGTRGLVVARTAADVGQHLASIDAPERSGWMAERFVQGTEMSVESFVADGRILFTNPTEYFVVGHANIAPAALPAAEAEAILELNAHAIAALGLSRGMTHLELYRTPSGPVFGEIAVRPPGGRIMRLLRRAYDFDPWEAVIRLEMGESPNLDRPARRVAGVWMLHPGPGRVVSVRGLAAAGRVLGIRKLVCRLRKGRTVLPRASTGSDVGWIEAWGRDRDQVAERLRAAHDLIRIEMAPADDAARLGGDSRGGGPGDRPGPGNQDDRPVGGAPGVPSTSNPDHGGQEAPQAAAHPPRRPGEGDAGRPAAGVAPPRPAPGGDGPATTWGLV